MKYLFMLLAAACMLLTGCSMSTMDLYALPERSEEYQQLQTAINAAMAGKEYSSPKAGENQQSVQMADLTGDGQVEYLVFAKGATEKPLQILIFTRTDGDYHLMSTVESYGTSFDQVEYVYMDDNYGFELVVGSQLADEVVRSVSVFSFADGQTSQIMNASYTKFVPYDLDADNKDELLILRPSNTEEGKGVAEYYAYHGGVMERSVEVSMSQPADNLKRIISGTLNDGTPAVYTGSAVDENSMITDVFAIVGGNFTNVSLSNESGTSVQTLRNYFVYAEDIDKDGVIELPDLIPMQQLETAAFTVDQQHLVRWYSMNSDGSEVDKLYTYHNFGGGWYLVLDADYCSKVLVTQDGNQNDFYVWNETAGENQKIMSIHTLTGQNRETVAAEMVILYQGDSVIYAAELFVSPEVYQTAAEEVSTKFHLIHRDWKTGET